MHQTLCRDDVVGQRISSIRCKTEKTGDGFKYVEAVLVLENGFAFAVNEAGVDGRSELKTCDVPNECDCDVTKRIACMVGRTITNVAISDSIPTLIVLSVRDALFGMDTGPPFNGFAPTTSQVGEYIDDDEIVDFWNRDPVLV